MRSVLISKGFVAGCSLAVALVAGGCADNGDRTVMDEDGTPVDPASEARTSPGAGQEGAAITLTGCLQKGDGSSFVVTQANAPSSAAGDTGTATQREQMRAAVRSYELEGDDDDQFEGLVGKQVRVTGRIAERSDLNPGAAADREVGTTGDRRPGAATSEPIGIDANDLAKVDVQTIAQVADACTEAPSN